MDLRLWTKGKQQIQNAEVRFKILPVIEYLEVGDYPKVVVIRGIIGPYSIPQIEFIQRHFLILFS